MMVLPRRAPKLLFVAALAVATLALGTGPKAGAQVQHPKVPPRSAEQPLPPNLPDAPRQLPPSQQRPDLAQPLPPPNRGLGQRPPGTPPAAPRMAQPEAPKPATPNVLPPLPTDPAKRLDALFERLQDSENTTLAKKAEAEIEKLFERSGSATVDLMFSRAKQAFLAKDTNLALDLLDYITTLQPGFAEAYHRRALIHLTRQDEEAALRDLRAALGLEPRHYLAMTGLAILLRNSGNTKGAYKVLTRVRELNPLIPEIKETLEKLRLDVEGQKI